MKIRHKEHGEVEGVEVGCGKVSSDKNGVWFKNGAYYYEMCGWGEVPETRLVDVTGECRTSQLRCNSLVYEAQPIAHFPPGFFPKFVDRYDIPDLREVWASSYSTYSDFERFMLTMKGPSLIIQKEEPCPSAKKSLTE